MKQIVFLFFTFSGICTGFAQKPAEIMDSVIVQVKPALRLYPNPARNKVEIGISGFEPGYVLVQLVDINGKPVRQEKRLIITGNEIIVFMFSEDPGLYLVQVKQGDKKVKSKLLIQ